MIQTQNKDGDWVQAIPEPLYIMLGLKKECIMCMRDFWTNEGYRGHYALKHILRLD